MKKIFAVGMTALLLAGACGLSACGDKKVAVDLRGKTYTFSATETWTTYYQNSNGTQTPIDNPEQWLSEHWDLLSDESDKIDFATSEPRTPAQVVERHKEILFNGNTGFLGGATVTVSAPTRTEGARFYCTATVVLADGQTLAEEEVFGEYQEYYKGYTVVFNEDSDTHDGIQVSVTDFDKKTGEIKAVSVSVTKHLGGGGVFIYHNKIGTSVNLTLDGEYFMIGCEYKLTSVTDLT